MTKKVIAIILAAVMLLSFASCTSKGNGGVTTDNIPSTTPEATVPQTTTISSAIW